MNPATWGGSGSGPSSGPGRVEVGRRMRLIDFTSSLASCCLTTLLSQRVKRAPNLDERGFGYMALLAGERKLKFGRLQQRKQYGTLT